MTNITIQTFKGAAIEPYLQDLGQLRMEVFREYPFLYDGDIEYEIDYLKTYANCPETTLVVIFDEHKIIGASTAIPLEFETPEFQQPFKEQAFNLSEIFYLGESVLLPTYRGQGIYRHFFEEREAAARQYGCLYASFCTVIRDENDKRRPSHYQPLDKVWQRFGYAKHPALRTHYRWKEIDSSEQSDKPMAFWIKTL